MKLTCTIASRDRCDVRRILQPYMHVYTFENSMEPFCWFEEATIFQFPWGQPYQVRSWH